MARRNGSLLFSTTSALVGMAAIITILVPNNIVSADQDVPMVFIFGDSLFDVGTNNFLNTKARADVKFHGIDYRDSRPTGRFSNGYNTADFIVKFMGYKRSPPPFLSLIKDDKSKYFFKRNVMLGGVNFASAGSGILKDTGKKFGRVISMGEQIQQFESVKSNITELMGKPKADSLLSQAFFLISVGGNDFFDLFFGSKLATINYQDFLSNLLSIYATHLKSLANLGARRIGVLSIPPIGCCPVSRLRNNGSCDELMNESALSFFIGLESILQILQTEFVGLQYSLGNSYLMTQSIIMNPLTFRFKEVEKACCGNGTLNAESLCLPTAEFCRERNDYLFWDMFHPTQSASDLAARTLFAGSPPFVTPFNFSHLTQVYV